MDDLAEKISSLLSDPEGLESLKEMAQSLMGENKSGNDSSHQKSDSTNSNYNSENKNSSKKSDGSMFDDIDMGQMMKLLSVFKSKGGERDDRSNLLLSLKPHLSDERKTRVDSAVKILKLVNLLPVISEMGILKDLF